MNIRECLEQGFLKRIPLDKKLIMKEFHEADYDLEKSEKAFQEGDFKWSIVKSYYAMFHAARAILFSLEYLEKRHFAIQVILEELHKQGKLESKYVNDFGAAISSREGADYHYSYSKETAAHSLMIAKEFLKRARRLC